jgi:ribosomal-protein-alanine N-acetyltransferase
MIHPLGSEHLGEAWSITQESEFFAPWTEVSLREELQIAKSLGLWRDGSLKAFVFFRELPDQIEISWLATRRSDWGRGLMRELLSATFDAHRHKSEVWLEVHENNLSAQKLYEKLGFKLTGKRPRYYHDGASALLYTKVL